jgi:hypothetical protein
VLLLFRSLVVGNLLLLFFTVGGIVSAQSSGTGEVLIDALVPGCGNGIIESGEECDGAALSGASCFTKGYTGGSLSCTSSCLFNTSSCVYTPPVASSGGGGGSAQGAKIVLTGRAYPGSQITILKDAQVVATTIADEGAHFQVLIKGLAAGTYIFSIYSEDIKGIRSSLFTFPVSVSRGILAKIDNVFVAPTITADKIEVKKGDPVLLFGQSYPFSEVTLEVNSEEQFFLKTKAASDGVYLKSFDSSVLEFGVHHAKARSVADEQISSQSSAYEFVVGTKNVYSSDYEVCSKKADLNGDCRVNLVDFSIVAFWYLRTLSPAFLARERAHLNGDGKINLVDFSIMAFHWTG